MPPPFLGASKDATTQYARDMAAAGYGWSGNAGAMMPYAMPPPKMVPPALPPKAYTTPTPYPNAATDMGFTAEEMAAFPAGIKSMVTDNTTMRAQGGNQFNSLTNTWGPVPVVYKPAPKGAPVVSGLKY